MNKILNSKNIKLVGEKLKKNGKKIVLCHGVFDLIHIGHIKHFTSAKKFGDLLVVSITSDKYVNKGPGRPIFNEKLRMEFLKNISLIDYVYINDNASAVNVINLLKPNIYCKGSDYKKHRDDVTREIKNEIKALKNIGGFIKYTNDITSSSSKLINNHYSDFSISQKKNIKVIKNKKISLEKILKKINNLKILVIGEIILDHYFFCETLGKSGKDPILQMHEQYNEIYLGGAAAVAGNVSQFSKNVSLLGMIGDDKKYQSFIYKNLSKNIKFKAIKKKNSPTIVKKKYLEMITNNKVFGSYLINDDPMSKAENNKLNTYLSNNLDKFDLVIVSDYGHGLISEKNSSLISKKSKYLSLNAQINAANRGFHTMEKYKNVDFVIINETELRHELRDKNDKINNLMRKLSSKINIADLVVTQGSEGATLFNKQTNKFYKMEAFASNVIDKIGSGDTMLSVLSLMLKSNIDKNFSLLIGSLAASQSVSSIGNKRLIDKIKLIKASDHILK